MEYREEDAFYYQGDDTVKRLYMIKVSLKGKKTMQWYPNLTIR